MSALKGRISPQNERIPSAILLESGSFKPNVYQIGSKVVTVKTSKAALGRLKK